MKILAAIDGSGHSEAVIEAIAHRQLPADSEVRVISVVEPHYSATPFPGGGVDMHLYDAMESASREGARKAVATAAATLRAGGGNHQLSVTTEVLSGSPKGVILEDAEAFGADLIVVGSHGHGMLERFLLGSVSQAVALHATCSVEIVRRSKAQAESLP